MSQSPLSARFLLQVERRGQAAGKLALFQSQHPSYGFITRRPNYMHAFIERPHFGRSGGFDAFWLIGPWAGASRGYELPGSH
jgi:hypothetical protein